MQLHPSVWWEPPSCSVRLDYTLDNTLGLEAEGEGRDKSLAEAGGRAGGDKDFPRSRERCRAGAIRSTGWELGKDTAGKELRSRQGMRADRDGSGRRDKLLLPSLLLLPPQGQHTKALPWDGVKAGPRLPWPPSRRAGIVPSLPAGLLPDPAPRAKGASWAGQGRGESRRVLGGSSAPGYRLPSPK